MELDNGNITYYSLIKISLKIYGIYLLIRGLFNLFLTLPELFKEREIDNYYLIQSGDDLFTGILMIIVGVILFSFTKLIVTKRMDYNREISLQKKELGFIVYCILYLILTVFIILMWISIGSQIILFIIHAIEDFDTSELLILLPQFVLLVITYFIVRNLQKISNWMIK